MKGIPVLRVFEAESVWAIIVAVGVLATFFFLALERSLLIPDLHIDGVYQTLSALDRLEKGDVVGKDFYFYLGLGPLYALYPVYLLAGADARASIFAAHLIVSFSFVFTFLFLAKSAFPKLRWPSVVILGILFTWLLELIFVDYGLYFKYPNFFSFLDPGNSLRPLRRFIPILTASVIAYLYFRNRSIGSSVYVYGVLGGLSIAWSNDYGLPTFGGLWIIVVWHCYCGAGRLLDLGHHTAKFLAAAGLSYFLLVALVTEGSVTNWLHYNFVGVSSDQWWYYKPFLKDRQWDWFSVWNIADRGANWPLSAAIILASVFIPFLFVCSFWRANFFTLIMAYIGLCLFSGAFLTEYLGHRDDYYWAAIMPWLLFVLAALTVALLTKIVPSRLFMVTLHMYRRVGLALLVAICFFFMTVRLLGAGVSYVEVKQAISQEMVYNERLGGYVTHETAEYLSALAEIQSEKGEPLYLAEEYFGLASAVGLGVNPTPFDSVIHALGARARENYLKGLEDADFVVTTNPLFSKWQSWSLSHNWWFYRYVIANFDVVRKFPNVVLWKRKAALDVADVPVRDCQLVREDGLLFIQFDELMLDRLVELSFDYELSAKPSQRFLLLLENGLSSTNRYTSLDAGINRAVTPVFLTSRLVTNGAPLYVYPNTDGKAGISVKHCNYKETALETDSFYFDERYVPLDIDFDFVKDGLDLERAVIYFEASMENQAAYTTGGRIKFSNGDIREIVSSRKQFGSNVLEVEYAGETLGEIVDGFPHRIELVD